MESERDRRLTAVLSALSDPTRRAILERLACTSLTVGEAAAPFDMSLQAVSRHLMVLEAAGLIRREPDGVHRRLHVVPHSLDDLTSWVLDQAPCFASDTSGLVEASSR